MNKADSLGLEVITYTINDREEAKRVIKLGVTAITTDRPGWLRSELSKL